MNKQQIKDLIFKDTGIDTRCRNLNGSLKGYIQFYIHDKGEQNQIQFTYDWGKSFAAKFPSTERKRVFTGAYSIEIHSDYITEN